MLKHFQNINVETKIRMSPSLPGPRAVVVSFCDAAAKALVASCAAAALFARTAGDDRTLGLLAKFAPRDNSELYVDALRLDAHLGQVLPDILAPDPLDTTVPSFLKN